MKQTVEKMNQTEKLIKQKYEKMQQNMQKVKQIIERINQIKKLIQQKHEKMQQTMQKVKQIVERMNQDDDVIKQTNGKIKFVADSKYLKRNLATFLYAYAYKFCSKIN